MSLLTYDFESLLGIITDFLNCSGSSQLTLKALKVLGASLNDVKLARELERIIAENKKEGRRIYDLMLLWSQATSNLVAVLLKLSPTLRQDLIGVIFSYYLVSLSPVGSLGRSLPQLLATVQHHSLL